MALDLVWIWYLATVSVAALVFGAGAPEGRPIAYAVVHLGLLAVLVALRPLADRLSRRGQLWTRGIYVLIALPVVFTSMAWTLPAVHPQPFEWTWMAFDRALLGVDPTVALQVLLVPWFTELLQWVYASFYFIPIVTIACIGWRRGADALEWSLTTITFAFLLSYLGYWLWPTLPPYRFLTHDAPITGVWVAAELHRTLDLAEVHKWNCFPSGHTMVSLVCVALAWRHLRALFWCLAPIVALLVLSTIVLRYHYFVDVVAGIAGVAPAVWIAGQLQRRD